MNNKFFFLALFSVLLLLLSCGERRSKAIDIAYGLLYTNPDSSLVILNGVNHSQLSKSEKARHALVYTIAQDKSGLDVDNDSLLRTAYTYYNSRTEDSLYAKSMYYTGKYYLLNDSSELAMDCLQKSVNAAEKQGDKYTQCLGETVNSYKKFRSSKGFSFSKGSRKDLLYNSKFKNKEFSLFKIEYY